MAIATVDGVAQRLGHELSADTREQIEALLDDAETLILSRIPDLYDRIASGALSPDVVALVETSAVVRVVRNPAGIQSQSAEGFSVEYSTRAASGFLRIYPDEWRMLGLRSGLFTIQPRLDVPVAPSEGW